MKLSRIPGRIVLIGLGLAVPSQSTGADGPRQTAPSVSAEAGEEGPGSEQQEASESGGKHGFGVWFGAGTLSNLGGLEDHETDGRVAILLGLRYSRPLLRRDAFTLQYFGDVFPVVLETNSIVAGPGGDTSLERKTVYGAGMSPLGARFVFRPGERLRPFLSGSGGFLIFSDDIPLPGARQFTFTGDVEGGVELHRSNGHVLTGGIRFHHVSNANTGDVNPGLNSFVFYAGYSVFR